MRLCVSTCVCAVRVRGCVCTCVLWVSVHLPAFQPPAPRLCFVGLCFSQSFFAAAFLSTRSLKPLAFFGATGEKTNISEACPTGQPRRAGHAVAYARALRACASRSVSPRSRCCGRFTSVVPAAPDALAVSTPFASLAAIARAFGFIEAGFREDAAGLALLMGLPAAVRFAPPPPARSCARRNPSYVNTAVASTPDGGSASTVSFSTSLIANPFSSSCKSHAPPAACGEITDR